MAESEDIATYSESSPTLSSYGDSNCTPFPSLTVSQRIELNKICHTGAITNNNVSTFSDLDMYENVEPQQRIEEHILFENESSSACQKQNNGCCIIM